jgi:hypothetical protein
LSCDEVTFMGILVKQVTLRGDKGQVELDGMFDTGATYSVIRKDIAEQIATVIPLDEPIVLRTAEQGRQLTVTHRVVLTIWLNGYRLSDEFLVLEELSRPVLIGAATMQKWRIQLDMANEEVIVDPTATELWLL